MITEIANLIQNLENKNNSENEWKKQIDYHFDIFKKTRFDVLNDIFIDPIRKTKTNLLGIVAHRAFQIISNKKHNENYKSQTLDKTGYIIEKITQDEFKNSNIIPEIEHQNLCYLISCLYYDTEISNYGLINSKTDLMFDLLNYYQTLEQKENIFNNSYYTIEKNIQSHIDILSTNYHFACLFLSFLFFKYSNQNKEQLIQHSLNNHIYPIYNKTEIIAADKILLDEVLNNNPNELPIYKIMQNNIFYYIYHWFLEEANNNTNDIDLKNQIINISLEHLKLSLNISEYQNSITQENNLGSQKSYLKPHINAYFEIIAETILTTNNTIIDNENLKNLLNNHKKINNNDNIVQLCENLILKHQNNKSNNRTKNKIIL